MLKIKYSSLFLVLFRHQEQNYLCVETRPSCRDFFMIVTIRTENSIRHSILMVETAREYHKNLCRRSSICMVRIAMYSEYVLLVIFHWQRMTFIYRFRWLKKALQQNTSQEGIRRSYILVVMLRGLVRTKQLLVIVPMRRYSSSRNV